MFLLCGWHCPRGNNATVSNNKYLAHTPHVANTGLRIVANAVGQVGCGLRVKKAPGTSESSQIRHWLNSPAQEYTRARLAHSMKRLTTAWRQARLAIAVSGASRTLPYKKVKQCVIRRRCAERLQAVLNSASWRKLFYRARVIESGQWQKGQANRSGDFRGLSASLSITRNGRFPPCRVRVSEVIVFGGMGAEIRRRELRAEGYGGGRDRGRQVFDQSPYFIRRRSAVGLTTIDIRASRMGNVG